MTHQDAASGNSALTSFGDTRAIAAAIVCVSISGFSISLSFPLLSLVMEARGVADALIGLNTAIAGLAALVIAPFAAPLARRFATHRVLCVALVLAAASLLAFPLSPTWSWFPLRFVFGAATTAIFVIGEFWINAAANESRRGLVMGIYASVLSIGFAAGPAVLAVAGSAGSAAFIIGAVAFAAALVPVYAARKVAPAVHGAASANFMAFLWIAPTATLAAFVFGAAEQTGFAFFALYGLRSGLAEFQSALLLTMVAVGNLVLQIPLGLLADRFDRTRLLLVCGIVGAAGMLALPYAVHTPWQAYALLLVWGGITGGFYTIGLTQLGSRFNGADLASANAMFVMLYSIGMMLGPFGAGMAMDHIGTNALTWLLAALFAAHAMIAGARVLALSR